MFDLILSTSSIFYRHSLQKIFSRPIDVIICNYVICMQIVTDLTLFSKAISSEGFIGHSVFYSQFEFVSQHLVFANCIPLVLKFFNQNTSAYVAAKNRYEYENIVFEQMLRVFF